MSSVVIAGDTSGTVTLQAPSVAGTTTLTLPASSGTVLTNGTTVTAAQGGTGLTSPGTSGNALVSDGTNWKSGKQTITSGTAVSASGTSVDFTSIPSWVKRITVMFSGVSTSGTSLIQLQIGSGSVTTTGYNSAAGYGVSATQYVSSTTGFAIDVSGGATAAALRYGTYVITLLGSNTWSGVGGTYSTAAATNTSGSGCSSALSGTLDRIRITTVNGTDTFDAGTINILYE